MSRPLLILIVLTVLIVGILLWLANADTEVPTTTIRTPVAPNAAPRN